jgi:hypothetical protein
MATDLDTTIYTDNEVAKTDDLNYMSDVEIANIGLALRYLLAPPATTKDIIVNGTTVVERSAPSMNVDVDLGLVYDVSLCKIIHNGSLLGPVPLTASDLTHDRIDILEVRQLNTLHDVQQRAFKDPNTGDISYQSVSTKEKYVMDAQVKAGEPGDTPVAPTVDAGWVKIAEIHVTANATTILDADIHNCEAYYHGDETADWTTEKDVTFHLEDLGSVSFHSLFLRAKAGESTTFTITGGVTPSTGSSAILKMIPDGTAGKGIINIEGSDGNDVFELQQSGTVRLTMNNDGHIGLGTVTSPTAYLHLPAGAAAAGTSPLKFETGTLHTTPEPGAVEYDGTYWWGTRSDGGRGGFAQQVIAGNTISGAVKYAGTTSTDGCFDGGTTNPSHATRLNYDGDLYLHSLAATGSISTNLGFYLLNGTMLRNANGNAFIEFESGKVGVNRDPTTYAFEVQGDIYATGTLRGGNAVLNTNRNTMTTADIANTYVIPAGTYYATITIDPDWTGGYIGLEIHDGTAWRMVMYLFGTESAAGAYRHLCMFIISDGTNYRFNAFGSGGRWQLIQLT